MFAWPRLLRAAFSSRMKGAIRGVFMRSGAIGIAALLGRWLRSVEHLPWPGCNYMKKQGNAALRLDLPAWIRLFSISSYG